MAAFGILQRSPRHPGGRLLKHIDQKKFGAKLLIISSLLFLRYVWTHSCDPPPLLLEFWMPKSSLIITPTLQRVKLDL